MHCMHDARFHSKLEKAIRAWKLVISVGGLAAARFQTDLENGAAPKRSTATGSYKRINRSTLPRDDLNQTSGIASRQRNSRRAKTRFDFFGLLGYTG